MVIENLLLKEQRFSNTVMWYLCYWEKQKGGRQMCEVYLPSFMLYLLELAGTRAVIWPCSIALWLKANLPRPSQAHRINICWPVTCLCPYITVFCCWLDTEAAVKYKTRVKLHTKTQRGGRRVSEAPHRIFWLWTRNIFLTRHLQLHLSIQCISQMSQVHKDFIDTWICY